MTSLPLYPGVGRNAPLAVQRAIDRFASQPPWWRDDHVLLYWLLGSSTGPFKMDPVTAEYGAPPPSAKAQRCGNCKHAWSSVATGEVICGMIRGNIDPDAWCRLWELPG